MRAKKFEPGTMILVEWQDIVSHSSWTDSEERKKRHPSSIKTVGIYLKTYRHKNKYCLQVAHNYTEDGESDTTDIPFGTIDNIKILKAEG